MDRHGSYSRSSGDHHRGSSAERYGPPGGPSKGPSSSGGRTRSRSPMGDSSFGVSSADYHRDAHYRGSSSHRSPPHMPSSYYSSRDHHPYYRSDRDYYSRGGSDYHPY